MSYVLPAFPADARFAGLVSNFNDPARTNRLQQHDRRHHPRRTAGRCTRSPCRRAATLGADALAQIGLTRDQCTVIRTNLRVSPLELCELRPHAGRIVADGRSARRPRFR